MISYEPGKWSVTFALSLTGSVLPKASVWAFSCSILSCSGHMAMKMARVDVDDYLNSRALTVFGGFIFILGFLVVFRSQQAYSRWWEGGTLLQQLRGEWFNAFSSLMAFCNNVKEKEKEVERFQHRLARLTSLLYSCALHQVTTIENPVFEVIELDGFDMEALKFLDETHDRCEVVLQWIQRLIVEANAAEIVKIAPPILSRVYNQLGNGIVNLNNARKISDFPIPFPLAQMLSLMLIIHWLAIAVICAVVLKHLAAVAFISFMAEIAYWSVNYIAVELEMPFGDDPNDLPLQTMQKDLNCSLKGLLHKQALSNPDFKMQPHTPGLNTYEFNFHNFVTSKQNRKTNMHYSKPAKTRASENIFMETRASMVGRISVTEESSPLPVETGAEAALLGRDRQLPEMQFSDAIPSASSSMPVEPVPPHNVHISSNGDTNKTVAASQLHDIDPSTCHILLHSESAMSGFDGIEDSIDRKLRELITVNHAMEGHLSLVVQELTALHSLSLTALAQSGERGGIFFESNREQHEPKLSMLPQTTAVHVVHPQIDKEATLYQSGSCAPLPVSCRL